MACGRFFPLHPAITLHGSQVPPHLWQCVLMMIDPVFASGAVECEPTGAILFQQQDGQKLSAKIFRLRP